ncbi:MAG: PH domain-containing protein [Propionibacteriaceae bacterium]|jgi:membrane protein YdbS with pleckstrin-like domain|nr:PH domain-containing protein [Propionibacteriaceae bacterium]
MPDSSLKPIWLTKGIQLEQSRTHKSFSIGENGLAHLPGQALSYWRIHAVFTAAFAVVFLTVVWIFVRGYSQRITDIYIILVASITVLVSIDLLIALKWKFRHYSFTVTGNYIYVVQGRFIRRALLIPIRCVISVEALQGPLMRSLGLYSLEITTLLKIDSFGPFTLDIADELRATITQAHSFSNTPSMESV